MYELFAYNILRKDVLPLDFPTHLKIGLLAGRWIEQTYGTSVLSPAFLWGCIEPDYEHLAGGLKEPKKRHTFQQDKEKIAQKIQALPAVEAFTSHELFQLGQIMHYLMDFHCYPHNADSFDISVVRHVLYEKQMGMTSIFYFNALFSKACREIDPLSLACNDPASVMNYLHTRYLHESGKFKKNRDQMILDVAFASMCCTAIAAGYLERCGYEPTVSSAPLLVPSYVFI